MKFIIDGHEYEAANLERVTGALALDLPKQTGMGLRQLAMRLEQMPRLGYDDSDEVVVLPEGADGASGDAVLDSEPHLRALLAFLWLSRRLDGERITFEESCEFPIASLDIVDDEPVEVVEPDPTQPGSDPVAVPTA